jgi:hypothetical protein
VVTYQLGTEVHAAGVTVIRSKTLKKHIDFNCVREVVERAPAQRLISGNDGQRVAGGGSEAGGR